MTQIIDQDGEVKTGCGPECDCNAPPRRSRARTAAVVVVLVVAAAIVVVKLARTPEAPESVATVSATETRGAKDALSGAKALTSFKELNKVAADKDAVFVLVPAPGSTDVGSKITRSVDAARRKLEAKDMIVGLYKLRADSPDHRGVAGRHALPGVLVFSRGTAGNMVPKNNVDRGMLTGDVTESKLLQAYVASSLAASGGGCNCGAGSTCGAK